MAELRDILLAAGGTETPEGGIVFKGQTTPFRVTVDVSLGEVTFQQDDRPAMLRLMMVGGNVIDVWPEDVTLSD